MSCVGRQRSARAPLRDGRWRRAGLTLLELLVVLVILSIVATVAVAALQPRIDNARFEATRRVLNEVEGSVLGPREAYGPDRVRQVSGFVADIGRLPMLASGGSPSLGELWDRQSRLAVEYPFRFRGGPAAPVDYSDVRLACGWRGPYLRLPLGSDDLRDGWGREFQYRADVQQQLAALTWAALGEYQQPLELELLGGRASVTGQLVCDETLPAELRVVLLVPDPERSATELTVREDEDAVATTFTFSEVPLGVRALVVHVGDQRSVRYLVVPGEGAAALIDITALVRKMSQQPKQPEAPQ